jgi:hypothetical protein
MAHFAEMKDRTVINVIVVNNDIITDQNGIEQENLGIAFCKSLFGENTEWLQTSYNGNFRGKYAVPGSIYDPELDEFKNPESEAVAE